MPHTIFTSQGKLSRRGLIPSGDGQISVPVRDLGRAMMFFGEDWGRAGPLA